MLDDAGPKETIVAGRLDSLGATATATSPGPVRTRQSGHNSPGASPGRPWPHPGPRFVSSMLTLGPSRLGYADDADGKPAACVSGGLGLEVVGLGVDDQTAAQDARGSIEAHLRVIQVHDRVP